MTRKEFYQNLYAKGIKDAETAKQYEQKWVSSGRGFDEDSTAQPAPEQQPKTPMIGNSIKGLKDVGSSAWENVKDIGKAYQQPFNNGLGSAHVLGQEAKLVGQVIASPISVPLSMLGSTFPQASNAIGRTLGSLAQMAGKSYAQPNNNALPAGQMSALGYKPPQAVDERMQLAGDVFNIASLPVPAKLGSKAFTLEKGAVNTAKTSLSDMIKSPTTKQTLENIADKIPTALKNEKGAIDYSKDIPDIYSQVDEIEKAGNYGTSANPNMTARQVRVLAGEAPKTSIKDKVAGIGDREATMLSLPREANDIAYSDYAAQAIKAKRGADLKTGSYVETPLDWVGKMGVSAEKKITDIRKKIGAEKDDYLKTIDNAIVSNNAFVDTRTLMDTFKKELREKVGAYIDENGNVKAAAEGIRDEALVPEAKKVLSMLDNVRGEATAAQLDALSANLRNFLTKRKSSELKPVSDQMDIVVGSIRDQINKELEQKAGELLTPRDYDNYIKAKRNYANIKNIEDELSKALGREVVQGSGIASRGASIAKRMVQSNADAGSKVLSDAVKKLTGYDLYKNANWAEIAMRKAGDARAESLLAQGVERAMTSGPKAALFGAAVDKGKKVVAGDPLLRTVSFYNKAQGKTLSQMVKKGNK